MKMIEVETLKGLSGKYGVGLPAGKRGVIDGDKHPIDEMVSEGYIKVIAKPTVKTKTKATSKTKKETR